MISSKSHLSKGIENNEKNKFSDAPSATNVAFDCRLWQ